MAIGERICQLRTEQGISQTDLAVTIGVSKQTLYKYENNIVTNVPSDKIERLAEALHTSPAYLMGWDDDPVSVYSNLRPIRPITLPILGSVSCGVPKYADQEFQGYVSVDSDVHADFALVANGDSMINAGIKDGYFVFVKQTKELHNGDLGVIGIGDEALLKRYYYYQSHDLMVLKAENPAYEDLLIEGPELLEVNIIGKAVFFQGPVK